MIAGLRALLERPIADSERRRAFVLATVIVVLAGVSLVALRPAGEQSQAPPVTTSQVPQRPGGDPSRGNGTPGGSAPSTQAEAAARRFLAGYLPYIYGRGSASAIRAASPQLGRRLRRERPRVSPATRRRRPRIADLSARSLIDGALVVAEIADGGVARYPIELVLERRGGRWQVARVGSD